MWRLHGVQGSWRAFTWWSSFPSIHCKDFCLWVFIYIYILWPDIADLSKWYFFAVFHFNGHHFWVARENQIASKVSLYPSKLVGLSPLDGSVVQDASGYPPVSRWHYMTEKIPNKEVNMSEPPLCTPPSFLYCKGIQNLYALWYTNWVDPLPQCAVAPGLEELDVTVRRICSQLRWGTLRTGGAAEEKRCSMGGWWVREGRAWGGTQSSNS